MQWLQMASPNDCRHCGLPMIDCRNCGLDLPDSHDPASASDNNIARCELRTLPQQATTKLQGVSAGPTSSPCVSVCVCVCVRMCVCVCLFGFASVIIASYNVQAKASNKRAQQNCRHAKHHRARQIWEELGNAKHATQHAKGQTSSKTDNAQQ